MGSMRNPAADLERKTVNFDEEAGMTEVFEINGAIPEEEEFEQTAIEVSVVTRESEQEQQRLTSVSSASSSSWGDTSFSEWSVPGPGPVAGPEPVRPVSRVSMQGGAGDASSSGDVNEELYAPQIKADIKSRMPGLAALTLPVTPELSMDMATPMDESDDESPGSRSPMALMTARRLAPLTTRRLKTRLQDPPPLPPPVSNQILSRCGSTVGQRRVSITSQIMGEEGGAAGVSEQENMSYGGYKLPGTRISLASMLSASRAPSRALSRAPSRAPSRVPSYTGILRTPLSAKSMPLAAAGGKTPGPGLAIVEEEQDPLDDESIPKYKKWKSERNWLIWTQYLALVSLVPLVLCSFYIGRLERVRWLGLGLWRWVALALVVISGRLMSGWLIKILVVLIERRYLLQKRVLYFVYGLRHAVKNCIWLALVLGVWKVIFEANKDAHHMNPVITKILWCFWITSLLWMIKVMAVKVAANSFHRAAYFDRIQDNLFHQYVLETLSGPPSFNTWLDFGTGQAVNLEDAAVGQEEQQQVMASAKVATTEAAWSAAKNDNISYEQQNEDGGAGTGTSMKTNDQVGSGYHQYGGIATSRSRLSTGSTLAMLQPQQPPQQAAAPIIARSPIPIQQDKLQELTSETVSAWTLKRLMKIIRNTNMTTYTSLFTQNQDWEIDSEGQAKAAAKQIFYNIARPGEKFLQFKDFLNFFPDDQATRAFSLFDLTEAGCITKKALMKWVVNVYKERRALALTLSDNRTVVAKLHRVLDVVFIAILITIFFLILGVNTSKLLVALSSTLLPSVFVFGNAARSTFESLIFLFVMHPFDVGDRISVDGQSLIVEELNILNTIFLSGSNEKIYYPNSLLSTKAISNFYRSPDQWDYIDFQIHVSTPVEKLGMLKERMNRYIESLPQFWYPIFRIVCKDIQDSNKMLMSLWTQHHLNYQEAGERWQRRSNMILHMKQQMEELGIGYRLPVADVTVTGVPVLDVRQGATDHPSYPS